MTEQPSPLYGNQPEPPRPAPPGLVDQITGVFTAPGELFQRLNKAPGWGWALGAIIVASLVVAVIWGLKVDVEELMRPALERNPKIQAAQIDMVIDVYKKFILPAGIMSALLLTPAMMAALGLFYWLVGKALPQDQPPTFRQAFSAAVVPSLVKLPLMLLIAVICLVRPIGGLPPDRIAPTSLGFFLHPESLRLQAALFSVELFRLAEAALAFLALRYLVRMKTAGALIGAMLPLCLGIVLSMMRAQ
jgi:uncharacterized protein YneF (UPF0154 family)